MNNQYDSIMTSLLSFFNDIIVPASMTIAAAILVVLGIVNGVRYAKAASPEEKEKAKKNIIGLAIGAAVCVASIWLLPLLINLFASSFGVDTVSLA